MNRDSAGHSIAPDVSEAEMQALDVDLDKVWRGVNGELWATSTGRMEPVAARVLDSPALARALMVSPSLLVAWVLASVAVFALGALVSVMVSLPVVSLLAPAVAAVAVSFAYGAGADPAYEITRTVPTSARMILLLRVSVVFVTNAAIGLLAMLLVPDVAVLTMLWLVPMTAISLLGLAVASVCHSATLGGAVAMVVWAAMVFGSQARTNSFDAALLNDDRLAWIPVYLGLAVVSLLVVLWVSGDGTRRRELAGWL